MKQREYIGIESIKNLCPILERMCAKSVFLVVAQASYLSSGARKYVDTISSSYQITIHSGFAVNPCVEDLETGIRVFQDSIFDVVVAIGGGSVIDMAKLINFFAGNKCEPRSYLSGCMKYAGESKPLIAIPTTSGTGSESTHFAALYVDHVKHSVADVSILPDVAIIDPELTMSMPPRLTAITGMDALGQAIESYWCVNSNDESKSYAKEAIKILMGNLETAVNSPCLDSRFAVAQAAHLAGKAINITKTTACHAISYPLTSFFGIPHGHAVALTLPSMLVYNAGASPDDTLDSRGNSYVQAIVKDIAGMLGGVDALGGKNAIESLMDRIGLERRLNKIGLQKNEDIEKIVSNGFNPGRVKNNPRKLTETALRHLLKNI